MTRANTPAVDELAGDLIAAAADRRPVPAPSASGLERAGAYAVQAAVVAGLRRGRRIAGWKVGLTDTALQARYGTDEPMSGVLFADDVHPGGARLALDGLIAPRLEVELAFVLGAPLRGPDVTPEQAQGAVRGVAAALEIVDSRVRGWSRTAVDLIADNGAAAAAVVGELHVGVTSVPLTDCRLQVPDGQVVRGSSAAVLGDPLVALAWLARRLSEAGPGLQPGDLVLSGTWTAPLPVERPGTYSADLGALGTVDVTFT